MAESWKYGLSIFSLSPPHPLGIESYFLLNGAMRGVCVLFLSLLAGNKVGAEGAGRLAEPLGKLTALQHLNLEGAV